MSEQNALQAALEEIVAERRCQTVLYGDQSGRALTDWPCILGEEYGELCEAIAETALTGARHPERGGRENILREACHVASVAVQLMEILIAQRDEDKTDGRV